MIYVYETTDELPVRQFEVQQSMKDRPLDSDPETGRPVRRVITGGSGFLGLSKPQPTVPAQRSSGCCGGSCGCH